jgi:hypothetical protein
MPVTAQEVIYKSLRLLGVLSPGEAPASSEAQDALYSLNSLIDSFSANPQYYYCTQDETFTLTTKNSYCIGDAIVALISLTAAGTTATAVTENPHSLQTGNSISVSGATQAGYNIAATVTVTGANTFTYPVAGGTASPATGLPVFTANDFYTVRPIRVVGAFTRNASNVDTPMGLITEQYWTNISDKAATAATPTKLLYRPNAPFGQIVIYPTPTGSLSIHIKAEKMISDYTSLTASQYLPFGYQRLLELSLAVDLAPEYGARAAPETVAYLKNDLANIMRTNLNKLPSTKIGAIPNANIYTDTTIGGSMNYPGQMSNGGGAAIG